MQAKRVCQTPGCPADAVTGDAWCTRHGGIAGPFRRPTHGGRDDLTRDEKSAVLVRDGHRCYRCGRHATEVDHVIPVVDGGARRDPRNLAAICHRCHLSKSGAEGGRLSRRL